MFVAELLNPDTALCTWYAQQGIILVGRHNRSVIAVLVEAL